MVLPAPATKLYWHPNTNNHLLVIPVPTTRLALQLRKQGAALLAHGLHEAPVLVPLVVHQNVHLNLELVTRDFAFVEELQLLLQELKKRGSYFLFN